MNGFLHKNVRVLALVGLFSCGVVLPGQDGSDGGRSFLMPTLVGGALGVMAYAQLCLKYCTRENLVADRDQAVKDLVVRNADLETQYPELKNSSNAAAYRRNLQWQLKVARGNLRYEKRKINRVRVNDVEPLQAQCFEELGRHCTVKELENWFNKNGKRSKWDSIWKFGKESEEKQQKIEVSINSLKATIGELEEYKENQDLLTALQPKQFMEWLNDKPGALFYKTSPRIFVTSVLAATGGFLLAKLKNRAL